MKGFLLLLLSVISTATITSAATDKLFCYFTNYATYRYGDGKFNVENIDPHLCTHLVYAYIGLSGAGEVQHTDYWIDVDLGAIERIINLKSINKDLKVLVALGGYNQGSVDFSKVTYSKSLRSVLVKQLVDFVRQYRFDGIDVVWEYPTLRGGSSVDKVSYITFLRDLKSALGTGKMLTATVSGLIPYIHSSYDVPQMNDILDYINIKGYDLRKSSDKAAFHHAALYSGSEDVTSSDRELNINTVIQTWIAAGANREKINLGISMFARSYELSNAENHTMGAKSNGNGEQGKYTMEPGLLSNLELCKMQREGGWASKYDAERRVPFMYKGNQWVAFDNMQSIMQKARYGINNYLAGFQVMSIDYEDHDGICGPTAFPSINMIKSLMISALSLANSTPPTFTTIAFTTPSTTIAPPAPPTPSSAPPVPPSPATPTTTATPATTEAPMTECPASGYYRDPDDCSIFYRCDPRRSFLPPVKSQCPATLVFDLNSLSCKSKSVVIC